jgi:hypothetical protein
MSKRKMRTKFNGETISEARAIELIEEDRNNIYKMKYASSQAIILALGNDSKEIIRQVDSLVESVVYENCETRPEAIKFIDEPSEELQLACVETNAYVIEHIDNPSPKVQIEAVKQNWETIELFEPTIETVYEATRQNTYVINRFNLNAFSNDQLIDMLAIVEDQEHNMFFRSNFYELGKDELIEEIQDCM